MQEFFEKMSKIYFLLSENSTKKNGLKNCIWGKLIKMIYSNVEKHHAKLYIDLSLLVNHILSYTIRENT